jgi:hypothetical protein
MRSQLRSTLAPLRQYRGTIETAWGGYIPQKGGLEGTARFGTAGAEKLAEYPNITEGTLEHHEAGHTILYCSALLV